jgi:hypothetical protein
MSLALSTIISRKIPGKTGSCAGLTSPAHTLIFACSSLAHTAIAFWSQEPSEGARIMSARIPEVKKSILRPVRRKILHCLISQSSG